MGDATAADAGTVRGMLNALLARLATLASRLTPATRSSTPTDTADTVLPAADSADETVDLDDEFAAMAPTVLREIALEQYTRALATLRHRAESRCDAYLRFGDMAVGILFDDGTLVGLQVDAEEQIDLLDTLEELTDGGDPTDTPVRVGAVCLAPGSAFHVVLLVADGDDTVAVPVWADRIQVVATSR